MSEKNTDYLYGDCTCSLCGKIHYCPEGCGEHDFDNNGKCTCTKCFIKKFKKQQESR